MKKLSVCCSAKANVDSSDEGTSCYMCEACNKPCDIYLDEMAELPVVVLNTLSYDMASEEGDKTVIGVYYDEYQRLKELVDDYNSLLKRIMFKINFYKRRYEQVKQEEWENEDLKIEFLNETFNEYSKLEYLLDKDASTVLNLEREYERLKNLDENVQKKIKNLKSKGIMTKWKRVEIELLESLYK